MVDQWFHSGIEGYCKACTELAGMPADLGSWGSFARELFNDNARFDTEAKVSTTWTLSRFRRGRSNRPNLFEDCWLGEHGPGTEKDAVASCATHLSGGHESSLIASVFTAMGPAAFARGFHEIVLPAISDGLQTERFHSSDIARFCHRADALLAELRPKDMARFKGLAAELVATLVYGPDHGLMNIGDGDSTLVRVGPPATDQLFLEAKDDTIRITQFFGENFEQTGYTEVFDGERVVFFGRTSKVKRYLEKCRRPFAQELKEKDSVIFPIASTHMRTSRAHGALARIGGTWYYHDFSSSGTLIVNGEHQQRLKGGVIALEPGDRLYLGAKSAKPDAVPNPFFDATALLISLDAKETSLF